jgi:hypothetical protein
MTRVFHMFFHLLLFTTSQLPHHSVQFLFKSLLFLILFSGILRSDGLTSMNLVSSGSTGRMLLDARHLMPDILHSANTSHGQFFNRNTSLLMDHMCDTNMNSDSSPVVSVSMTICALKFSHYLFTLERVVLSYGASASLCFRGATDG